MRSNRTTRWQLLAASLFAFFLVVSPVAAQEASPSASAAAQVEPEKKKEEPKKEEPGPFDKAISTVNGYLAKALFFDASFGAFQSEVTGEDGKTVTKGATVPFIVAVLALGSVFFTLWFRFINVRGFKHAIDVVRGRYDNPDDEGEISHFHALTSALSATVGLGNIAGVAIAIQKGGPGAVFWMIVMAVFGMTAKFSSCTLSQLYRKTNPDGTISGGPMYYLDLGLKAMKLGPLGKGLGILYAIMIMGGSFGGGNMFQSNQSWATVQNAFSLPDTGSYVFGGVLAVLVALVIIGGIRRIGAATSRVVPAMAVIYILASLVVIFANIAEVPKALGLMVSMAFTNEAVEGGAIGVLVIGVQRAAFSNEAGLGSAAIAHAAAKTDEPVREGLVAMLGPFIDTIIICLMTATVVIVTGTWSDPSVANEGVVMTSKAFSSVITNFDVVLSVCVLLFAYSTMISWAYYGERGWIYLLDHFNGAGLKTILVYRIIFVTAVFVGAVANLGPVLDFSDLMILCMAFPNIVGSVILAPKVLPKVTDYWRRLTSGEMKPYEPKAAE